MHPSDASEQGKRKATILILSREQELYNFPENSKNSTAPTSTRKLI